LSESQTRLCLETGKGRPQLVSRISYKPPLGFKCFTQTSHQLIDFMNDGSNFLGGITFLDRAEISVRTCGDIPVQLFQRRQSSADTRPNYKSGKHNQQELGQQHGSDDLSGHFFSFIEGLCHLNQDRLIRE
jgi:hypothetical protein